MKSASFAFALLIGAWAPICFAQSARVPLPPPLSAEPGVVIQLPAGAEARGGDEPPSRWQAELDRLDADLRLRLLTANEPRVDWLAGEMDTTDIESQVRHFTAARTSAPGERLYLASLAVACMQPVRPSLAPCDAVDRLADWARRDNDNGIPSLLLADRARVHGETDLAAGHLEEAAVAARFDDYWSQAALRWWEYLQPLPVDVAPAAKAKAAANHAAMRELAWATPLRALCAGTGARTERVRDACAKLGLALMTRGATFALQRAGARVAEINAANPAARATAQTRHARILATTARCAQAQPDFATALEAPDETARARGVEQFAAWARAEAQDGEVAACERLLAATPRGKPGK